MDDISKFGQGEGWRLAETIDMGRTHVYLAVARAEKTPFKSDRHALGFVLQKAQAGSKPHMEALRIVAHSRIPTSKKGRKK